MSSQMVARYFNKVLGVVNVPFERGPNVPFETVPNVPFEAGPNVNDVAPATRRSVIMLLDVRDDEPSASLEQMGSRMLEAIRAEWIKKSADNLPEFEWMRAGQRDWLEAVLDRGPAAKLVIVCGAGDVHQTPKNVLHVPSLIEMQASPVVKRDAWRAMQKSLAET